MFKKILIANRGEIAVRILRACHELGIAAVAVYSDVDRGSLHVRMADEAYRVGPAPSRESYLVIDKIIGVARASGCDAIHPGYGFLAENPAFARACQAAGVTFIGPPAAAMERLGSKTAARHVARETGVPTVAGTLDPLENAEAAVEAARSIGYPIVLKAVAGGGGKGMRRVDSEENLRAGWRDASSEALNAFGDARMYLEKFLIRPRHIEIQILADAHGQILYLGERECSVQRRYQKVIEEAPSPVMTPELRRAMGEAAVKLARAGGYVNAGTCEFLVDENLHFYFLEMNTRLQVEHPVTEMVTSLDLVKLQIAIASGAHLALRQEEISMFGHAIECRIYAEDPENNFFPSPGLITHIDTPSGPGIRWDEGVYPGWTVPNDYDPMLGKLIARGEDREESIARISRALAEMHFSGIRTNVGFFQRILAEPDFLRGAIHTKWLDDVLQGDASAHAARGAASSAGESVEDAAAIAAVLWHAGRNGLAASPSAADGAERESRWKKAARLEQVDRSGR
jgi:acetyl-CoA carboxylase biotin carboxylase subunit